MQRPMTDSIRRAAQRRVNAKYLRMTARAIVRAKVVDSFPKVTVIGETRRERLARVKRERNGLFGIVGGSDGSER